MQRVTPWTFYAVQLHLNRQGVSIPAVVFDGILMEGYLATNHSVQPICMMHMYILYMCITLVISVCMIHMYILYMCITLFWFLFVVLMCLFLPKKTRETTAIWWVFLRFLAMVFQSRIAKRVGIVLTNYSCNYCWWFRNPKQPPGMYKTCQNPCT